ncbi:iron reductase domain protein [Hyaloscypha bicolor E]|uniref:Iron reductase domain protein n=1 Tax=Hyaloscypha bicolor E TaxID=1095630 RepID=A0A2J6THS8_9HELO|nr:iron reductase domain protein [Hyaloscypha bicolor E]PMD62579.1 iron reductase domain protein [Hyaloscypha bicolor E]
MVHDFLTGITFSAYTSGYTGIAFGVALPMNVSDPYDAIISITAPVSNTTWAGFAWGGTMVWNPLTVAWANGLRRRVLYTLLKGTMVNSTHWTMIAKCSGCTSYQGNDGEQAVINGTGIVQFAWAQGTSAVTTPPNNASAFNVHQAFGK